MLAPFCGPKKWNKTWVSAFLRAFFFSWFKGNSTGKPPRLGFNIPSLTHTHKCICMAMDQNPVLLVNDPNPHQKSVLKWVVNSPTPQWDPIGVEHIRAYNSTRLVGSSSMHRGRLIRGLEGIRGHFRHALPRGGGTALGLGQARGDAARTAGYSP